MVKILFVCLGNICRSPMAESVCAHLIAQRGLAEKVSVASAAARTDGVGKPPYHRTREKLEQEGVPLVPHIARLMTKEDSEKYDYLIGMDEGNLVDMRRIIGEKNKHKIHRLLDFTSSPRELADPWYTHDFNRTYDEVVEGCTALLDKLCSDGLT